MSYRVGDLARRLARDAEAVCRHYLPHGRRHGRYWLVGDVTGAPGKSLYVRLAGPDYGPGAAGKWTDAATGEHGDLLDLIALNRGLPTFREAAAEASGFLCLPHQHPSRFESERSRKTGSPDAARRLFQAGRSITATHAEAYLRARGITARLDWPSLRFHPDLWYRAFEGAPLQSFPGLLAAVTDLEGRITGLQRTWLDHTKSIKAAIPDPRRALGHLLGNGVRFGSATDVLAAGEGIETVLSLKSVLPDLPMVAALSANHLAALILPPGLLRLYIVRDRDVAGRRAAKWLRIRARKAGIEVRDLLPVHTDFNDDLRRLGAVALLAAAAAQLAPQER